MLCAARVAKRLTLAEVGEACGVTDTCALAWESGHSFPQAARIWRLAQLLELDACLIVHACDPRYRAPLPTPDGQEAEHP